jgi:quercetin dioxygenase-like cupin family protein
MKIKKYLDVKPSVEMPGVLKREVVNKSDGAPNFCMRVFELEPGASTPFHTHDWEHEVFVLNGTGTAVSDKGETPVSPESIAFVPPNEKHCFKNTGKETLRFICVIPFTD